MRKRPLYEELISLEDDSSDELINWLMNHATFKHDNECEFMIWIPPFENYKSNINGMFGEDMPNIIFRMLEAIIKEHAEDEDMGYLLIAFV